VSSIYIPSFSEISAVAQGRGADSKAPGLWRGLVGAWPLQEVGGKTAFDVSGYRNHGTLKNMDAATDHVVTPMGRALDFDGSNDYVRINTKPVLTNQLTVCEWVLFANAAIVGGACSFCQQTWGAYTWDWEIYHGNSTPNLDFRAVGKLSSASPVLLDNSAYHICGVYDGANLRLYVNGKQSGADVAATGNVGNTAPDVEIGRGYNAYFSGRLANNLIFSRALSLSEIRSLYADPWAMYTLRRRVQVRGAAVGTTIRWPWQQRRRRRTAGVS